MTCTPRLRALMILRLVRLNAAVCGLAGETTWTWLLDDERSLSRSLNDPSPMRGGLAPGFPGGMGVTDWPDRCGHCGGAIAAGPGADPQGRESGSIKLVEDAEHPALWWWCCLWARPAASSG